jgi:heme oxygenase
LNLSEQIKIFTASSHQKLEKSIVRLIRLLETKQDYIHLLGLFYSYFGGVECLVESQDLNINLPDFMERRKASYISEDILVLQGEVPELVHGNRLPKVEDAFQALGALYVLEGSTLGGVHIGKMIQKKLPDCENAFRFFSGYGEQNMNMWEKFKEVLNGITGSENNVNSVLSGAEDTFQKFGEWINFNEHVVYRPE